MFRTNAQSPGEKASGISNPTHVPLKQNGAKTSVGPKYPKPKVLLVDLKDDSEAVLRTAGYNVHIGTLGTPYTVPKSSSYRLVARGFKIPNSREQEIVVIDLAANTTMNETPEAGDAVTGDYDYWGKCNYGVIDPRPVASKVFREPFDLIQVHGGVFIVFTDYPKPGEIKLAQNTSTGLDMYGQDSLELWSFLKTLSSDRFQIKSSQGSEIYVLDTSTAIGKLLNRHLKNAHFKCIFGPLQYNSGGAYNQDYRSWLGLATDKYGYFVAGAFTPREQASGLILLVPQIARKSQFLIELFRDVLPDLVPSVFPYAEGRTWIDKDEYQVPEVLELQRQAITIKAQADERIQELEQEILIRKERASHLRQLLTETGDPLVMAVKVTLEQLGFASVIDADEETKKEHKEPVKREDLRVVEDSTTLLVEVKGITGLPADEDALQVHKYVPVRMREWKHTNVQGLAIINHQKGVPPLGRENENTFRDDIIVNAEEQQFGLMTTWDLFRLSRSYEKLGWKPQHVKPLFFQAGRVKPVPVHYVLIGIVEHFWEKVGVVGIALQSGELAEGDRIGFELSIEFEEQTASSLQVDNQQVEVAHTSQLVGIKTDLSKDQLRTGTRVFRVT